MGKYKLPQIFGRRDVEQTRKSDPEDYPKRGKIPAPSGYAWSNRWQKNRIDAYKGVIDSATGLAHSMTELQRAGARFDNVAEEIRYDRLAVETNNEAMEEQKEDIKWERERKNHEREEIRASWKNGEKKSKPIDAEVIEPDDVEFGDEVK